MNLLVSTNVYKPGQLARVIPHLHAFRGQIGVELFPMFDADCYEEELLHCLPEFEGIPVSFHGPYYETEHSAAPGTPEYAHSMDLIRQTLPYCVRLQSQYLVFHHNNIPVTEERREEMIQRKLQGNCGAVQAAPDPGGGGECRCPGPRQHAV